jgi:glutamyl-tRNA synthetase
LPLRIMLVGGKFGPDVFKIVETIGKNETIERIKQTISNL